MKKFWKVRNINDSEGELILYGVLASERPWWDYAKEEKLIVPTEFLDDMSLLANKSKIILRINSEGGDVFAAHAISTQLKLSKAYVEAIVDGIAASAATVVLAAANIIKAPANALLMWHDPVLWMQGYFRADEMIHYAEAVKTVKESIIEAYDARYEMDREEISTMMAKETWMTGAQAKEKGLVDELLFQSVSFAASAANSSQIVVGGIPYDKTLLKSVPTGFLDQPKTEREETTMEEGITNTQELEAQYPQLVAEIRNQAVAAERARLQNIESIAANIAPELVNEAKYTKPMDAQALAFQALAQDKAQGARYLNQALADNKDSGAQKIGVTEGDPEPPKAADQTTSMFKSQAAKYDRSVTREEK